MTYILIIPGLPALAWGIRAAVWMWLECRCAGEQFAMISPRGGV